MKQNSIFYCIISKELKYLFSIGTVHIRTSFDVCKVNVLQFQPPTLARRILSKQKTWIFFQLGFKSNLILQGRLLPSQPRLHFQTDSLRRWFKNSHLSRNLRRLKNKYKSLTLINHFHVTLRELLGCVWKLAHSRAGLFLSESKKFENIKSLQFHYLV